MSPESWSCSGSPTGPRWADLPDQKGWRIKADADYGPLNTFARGKVDLAKIRRHWEDILRVVASIYTGTVRAYDVVAMRSATGTRQGVRPAVAARAAGVLLAQRVDWMCSRFAEAQRCRSQRAGGRCVAPQRRPSRRTARMRRLCSGPRPGTGWDS